MAGWSSPSNSLQAASENAWSPSVSKYSWLRVPFEISCAIRTSTFATTGRTHGLLSSLRKTTGGKQVSAIISQQQQFSKVNKEFIRWPLLFTEELHLIVKNLKICMYSIYHGMVAHKGHLDIFDHDLCADPRFLRSNAPLPGEGKVSNARGLPGGDVDVSNRSAH